MNKQGKKSNPRIYLFLGALTSLTCIVLLAAAWTAVNHPAFASIIPRSPVPTQENLWAQVEIVKPLPKPADTNVFAQGAAEAPAPADVSPPPTEIESTPAPTDESASVPAEAPVSTPEVTETPAELAMEIVPPTPTSAYVPPANPQKPGSVSVGNGVRWIDVDLTNQMVYAYEGDVIVNSFLVSTGTWLMPTVTGQYKIYVKYRSAKMSGPGYYLPNVPYIMYFYKGYGLHGTYWHNNFGTPMSHGCVNLSIPDAEWLYGWASVGTLVNVHY